MTIVAVYFGALSAKIDLFGSVWNIGTPEGVGLKTAGVPDSFGPSMERGWLVNLFSVPVWVWFASIIPAIMATILLYLDQILRLG